MMPRKTAHELLCDGQWDREYGSHVPLTVPWAPQVGRDLVVLWDRLTDVVYNGRKIIMEMTWNVWVAFALLLGMFLAMLGYALNLKRFLPWLIIKSLRQRNQESEDIINKLSTYDEAREEVYTQALIRKNQVEDENVALREQHQIALEKIEKLENLLGIMTRRHNDARESAMVWIAENSELRDIITQLKAKKPKPHKKTRRTPKDLQY